MKPARRRRLGILVVRDVFGRVLFDGTAPRKPRHKTDPRFAKSKWRRRVLAAGLKGKC